MSKRRHYTKEQVSFILDNYKGISTQELADRFNKRFNDNVTKHQMSSFKRTRKLRSGYRVPVNRLFTDEQEKYFMKIYKGKSSREAAKLMNERFGTNFTMKQIQSYKKNRKLRSGYDAQFKKGHVPVNKGKTWDEYMSKEGQRNSRKTTFKKGHRPSNYRPIGSERIDADGYIEVKVDDPSVWETKHKLVWEKEHGPIPEGYRLMFLDGNRQNCSLDNLKLVPYAVGAIMNKNDLYTKGNKELNEAGSLIAEIIHKKANIKKGR